MRERPDPAAETVRTIIKSIETNAHRSAPTSATGSYPIALHLGQHRPTQMRPTPSFRGPHGAAPFSCGVSSGTESISNSRMDQNGVRRRSQALHKRVSGRHDRRNDRRERSPESLPDSSLDLPSHHRQAHASDSSAGIVTRGPRGRTGYRGHCHRRLRWRTWAGPWQDHRRVRHPPNVVGHLSACPGIRTY
jgi:hypothetical protein